MPKQAIHVIDLTVPHTATWWRNQRKMEWRKTNLKDKLARHVRSAREKGRETMFADKSNHDRLELFRLLAEGECHYCGKEAVILNERTCKYNGIDRIDNTRGYVPGNMVSACSTCNMAKGELSRETFLRMCSRVHTFNC